MCPTRQSQGWKWQPNDKAPYARRLRKMEWEKHETEIKKLHAEGQTKKEIMKILESKHGFAPSYGQFRKRLAGISKVKKAVDQSGPRTSRSEAQRSQLISKMDSEGGQLHLRHSIPKAEACPAQDDEQIFRTYTCILDENQEESVSCPTEWPSVEDKSYGPGQQSTRAHATTTSLSSPRGTLRSDALSMTTAVQAEEGLKGNDVTLVMAVDCDDGEEYEPEQILGTRSASIEHGQLQEHSGRPYSLVNKGRRYYGHKITEPNTPRTDKQVHRRTRCVCCPCRKTVHPTTCRSSHHKQCPRCELSTSA